MDTVGAPGPAGRLLRAWRRFYGANPLHLLAMVGCFALSGYVVSMLWTEPSAVALAVWFAGAVIGHDLVLYPLYALADQPLTVGRWARRKVLPRYPPLVPAINHVRVPALGSAVLGLIWFPSLTGRSEEAFRFAAGQTTAGLERPWLLITAVLFLGSAVIYAGRLGVAAGHGVIDRLRRGHAESPNTESPDAESATVSSPDAPNRAEKPQSPASGSETASQTETETHG